MGKERRASPYALNGGVNLPHEADGFDQGHHHSLIGAQVFQAQARTILEPFVADLIAPYDKSS
jgi:hypothetical protein